MGININSLHIGSHVLVDGKMVRVESIDTLRPKDAPMRLLVSRNNTACGNPSIDEVEPIPITAELLKEVGLEEWYTEYRFGEPYVWYIDSESAQIKKENIFAIPTISASSLGEAGYTDWWAIRVITGDKPTLSGSCTVRYLHEAEAFLALHNVELIKD